MRLNKIKQSLNDGTVDGTIDSLVEDVKQELISRHYLAEQGRHAQPNQAGSGEQKNAVTGGRVGLFSSAAQGASKDQSVEASTKYFELNFAMCLAYTFATAGDIEVSEELIDDIRLEVVKASQCFARQDFTALYEEGGSNYEAFESILGETFVQFPKLAKEVLDLTLRKWVESEAGEHEQLRLLLKNHETIHETFMKHPSVLYCCRVFSISDRVNAEGYNYDSDDEPGAMSIDSFSDGAMEMLKRQMASDLSSLRHTGDQTPDDSAGGYKAS